MDPNLSFQFERQPMFLHWLPFLCKLRLELRRIARIFVKVNKFTKMICMA